MFTPKLRKIMIPIKALSFTSVALLLVAPKLAAAIVIPINAYDWAAAREIVLGLRVRSESFTDFRPNKIHVARIDVGSGRFSFATTPLDPAVGHPMPEPDLSGYAIMMKCETTSDFLKGRRALGENMVFAVNCSYFAPWTPPYTHAYAVPADLIVSDGLMIAPDNRVGDSNPKLVPRNEDACIVVYNDKRAGFRNVTRWEDVSGMDFAGGGYMIVLRDGKNVANASKPYPRTIAGVSADGRYVYFLCSNGKFPLLYEGITLSECAQIMLALGASSAVEWDGGGSASMVTWENGKAKFLLNHGQRKVCNSVGVIYKPASSEVATMP